MVNRAKEDGCSLVGWTLDIKPTTLKNCLNK